LFGGVTQRRIKRRVLYAAVAAALLAGILAVFSLTAGAELRTFLVRLPTGAVIKVTVDAPPGLPMGSVPGLPGTPISEIGSSAPPPQGGSSSGGGGPSGGSGSSSPSGSGGRDKAGSDGSSGSGRSSGPASSGETGQGRSHGGRSEGNSGPEVKVPKHRRGKDKGTRERSHTPLRNPDGSPTRHNPTFFDALPSPNSATSVPNFVIRQFHVPIFLLPIYQAAGNQYGIRWEILAAINEIESDYGRNLSVSTAGAVGWMQFLPSTWRTYGVDANGDKKKDPYNPVDAIFAAANYLKAAGGQKDIRRAIFAYNHAGWYVDSVMLRAKLIAGVPGDLVGSLTGLTEGRFPVAAHARYADDVAEAALKARKVKAGQNAANLVQDAAGRKSIDIFAGEGSPVIATGDGVIKKIGESDDRGRFIVLQDVYGNQYTYNQLGSVARVYPVPKVDASLAGTPALSANGDDESAPKPSIPASAGRQLPTAADSQSKTAAAPVDTTSTSHVVVKPRVFAHPWRANAKRAGSLEQMFDETTTMKGFSSYSALFTHVIGLNARNASLKPLKKGSQVVAGTLLGRVGKTVEGKGAHLNFEIRPAGKGAPSIDPKPILDGWKLLESTAIYHANGKNALYGNSASIGQILLLPKPLLEKRVLHDPRVDIYGPGRNDVRTGQIDRRVLATLEYLAESGLRPSVSCLKSGHARLTTSGNVSEHWSGNAVDISSINGIPILGHQDKGGITEQTVRRLMTLQGTMRPHQIISLLDFGANTLHMADHADHVHVGFRPLFGENKKLGQQALVVLKPGQWSDLIARLSKLENPVVPTKPSKFALPAAKRSSSAHGGE
jgi:hypothetical protein